MFAEADLEAMRRLRLAMDPLEQANRGKMFPTGEPPALHFTGLHPLEKEGLISRE